MGFGVEKTDEYERWFRRLRDVQGRARISARIAKAARTGEITGDCEPVGDGVSEMRFHFGPGYRVYFQVRKVCLLLLLIGGDKSTQKEDIRKAKELARLVEDDC